MDKASVNRETTQLTFLTITDGQSIKDPTQQQIARTQAIKASLHRKRRSLQVTNNNFVKETPGSIVDRRRRQQTAEDADDDAIELPRRCVSVSNCTVDPFETLPVNADRLTRLLQHSSARQAGEPMFSIDNTVTFMALRSVFGAGFEDPALGSALYLELAFAANGGILDRECTSQKLKTIQHVNQRLSDTRQAASAATVGTVLILVGIEGRLGQRETAQIHMNGVRDLLHLCRQQNTHFSNGMKRAIFWQDLLTAVSVGTSRVVNYETFPELRWYQEMQQPGVKELPPGFARRSAILGREFLMIVGDICVVKNWRESRTNVLHCSADADMVDTQQACIESRLQDLQEQATEPLLLCCIPAAFLCVFYLFAEVWASPWIPTHVLNRLLRMLQRYQNSSFWNEHADLLLWLLSVGAVFATNTALSIGFADLWQGVHDSRLRPLCATREDAERSLREFIWSDTVYGPRWASSWSRLCRQANGTST